MADEIKLPKIPRRWRRRIAVYIAMGGLAAMGVIGMLSLHNAIALTDTERLTILVAVIGNVVTGIVGLGHKAFESEEKGP